MLNKIAKYFSWAVMLVSVVLAFIFFTNNSGMLEDKLAKAEQMPSEMKVEKVSEIANDWSGTVLNWAIGLLIVAAGIGVITSLINFVKSMIESKQGLIRNLISVGVIVLIVILGFSLASDTIPHWPAMDKLDFELTNELSKRVGAVLHIMYLFLGISIVGAIFSEVSKLWK